MTKADRFNKSAVDKVANLEWFSAHRLKRAERLALNQDNGGPCWLGPLYRFVRSDSFHSQKLMAPEITTATALPQSGM